MERDAISADVRRGGLKSTTEIKILVLYLLTNVNEPLPASQLSDLLHLDGIANTFEVSDAFYQLEKNGLIYEDEKIKGAYNINAKGKDAGQALQSGVPFTVREKALNIAKKMLLRNRHMKETEIVIERNENGNFITCSALENDKVVMSFTLKVADDSQIFKIKDNFLDDPALYYRTLIDMLTK